MIIQYFHTVVPLPCSCWGKKKPFKDVLHHENENAEGNVICKWQLKHI